MIPDRYAAMFARLGKAGEGAFGAFVMLGDPTPAATADILDALVEGGADMIEVGIPFSDPIADGPVQFESGTLGSAVPPATGALEWTTPDSLDAGTYAYFCRIHPFMRGAFRVK